MLSRINTINLFIRSLLFSIYSITTIIIYSFFCVIARGRPLEKRHAIIRIYLRAYMSALRFLCRLDYRVEGLENLPKNGNGIIFSKHQSTWETMLLPLIFHDPAVIIKRELLWIPFFGWGLAGSDPIAINRSDKSTAMQQIITKGRACLQAGRWVLVFPEGTRTEYGKPSHYHLGGARLAAATGYPVYPVAHNAGRHWPRRKFLKIPGTITVVIGPAITTQGKAPDVIMSEAKTWIESTMERIA
jgi:1-acyl-sn-glycerol-3-phosphate acyltransferase